MPSATKESSKGASQGAETYDIPDVALHSPDNRKLKVLCIGAGVSGIMMAYNIQKSCRNVDFVIYEKNHDIGGTWLENRYPGCACDVPSHAYTYNFALNPEWPKYFSYSPDIFKYLTKVVEVFNLRHYMTFNTEVVRCDWQEKDGQWKVTLKQTSADGSSKVLEETCDLLLHAMGILNNYKWPEIKGIEKFKGKVIHTARWPDNYGEDEWKGQSVGVIGSGASSIQTVPTMQPHVKHLDVFVRTGVWFVALANNVGQNHVYSDEEREKFRKDPAALVEHAKSIEDQVNGLWSLFFKDSPEQKAGADLFRNRMAEFIKDKRLLEGFTPKFGVGCRRVTPGDPYMHAIQEPNVDVHFTAVDEITEDGIIGSDGIERKVDTVVCATGFDVSYRPRFPIVGRDGIDLRDKWKQCPESYLGLACPDFPNMIMFIGPTWPVENGSVMGPLGQVGDYTIQIIKKMQGEFIKSWVPKQEITDQFNAHVQEFLKRTVWVDDCRAWYKDNVSGRVNAVYSGSSLHYMQTIQTPRYEDFEIDYQKVNPWAYLGLGFTQQERNKEDASPYLNKEAIDPRWMEALKIGK